MIDERTVHVVQGSTGEYSDNTTWGVAAFSTQEEAEDYAFRATAAAKTSQGSRPHRYGDPTIPNPYDPNMKMDYTGTEYYVISVPLKGAL